MAADLWSQCHGPIGSDGESTIEVEDVYVTVDPRDNEEVLAGLGRELRRNYLQCSPAGGSATSLPPNGKITVDPH